MGEICIFILVQNSLINKIKGEFTVYNICNRQIFVVLSVSGSLRYFWTVSMCRKLLQWHIYWFHKHRSSFLVVLLGHQRSQCKWFNLFENDAAKGEFCALLWNCSKNYTLLSPAPSDAESDKTHFYVLLGGHLKDYIHKVTARCGGQYEMHTTKGQRPKDSVNLVLTGLVPWL